MTPIVLDGKSLAKEIEANLYNRAKTIIAKTGVTTRSGRCGTCNYHQTN